MTLKSAGILMYREQGRGMEVLLVHPGGPFWSGRDLGAWSIPKGEYVDGEDPLTVARREFREETGFTADGDLIQLTPIRQPSGKVVSAWGVKGDCNAACIVSNRFTMEWPRKSGRMQDFPEVDRAEWFSPERAKQKLLKGQVGFVDELCRILGRLCDQN